MNQVSSMSLALLPGVIEGHSLGHVELVAVPGESSQLDLCWSSGWCAAVVGEF